MTSPGAVRIGLVGAGRMGTRHLRALAGARGVSVAGVVEPAPALRSAAAAAGYRVHSDAQELLDAGGLDAVLIAAPSDLHLELVRTFADTGTAVLCEKPLGVRASDARAATEAARQRGIPLQIGYWRRFVPALHGLRERIGSGELGELSQISCLQWDAEPPLPAFRARSGGIAVDMAVHELDQARWLTGQDVAWVAAARAGGKPAPRAGGERDARAGSERDARAGGERDARAGGEPAARDPDAATILAALSGGAAATISVGRRFPHGDCCWLEVFGTSGYERLQFMWGEAGDQVLASALVAQIEAFAALVHGEAQEGAGGEDAIAALTAAELAGEALVDGERKRLVAA